MEQSTKPDDQVPVADVEVTSVTPERAGFTLEGVGADRSDYRVRLELEVPLDQRTRSVLGEMLSQCKLRIWRKIGRGNPLAAKLKRDRGSTVGG